MHEDGKRSVAVPLASRLRRNLAIGVVATGVALLGIEVLAHLDVRRARAARQKLGNHLYTRGIGQGEPVVFIPGLQASTRYWQGAFDPLAANHKLIFVDLVGFGQSPWPDIGYTLEDQLVWLRRTLVAHGATKNVTFVAHSFGTIIAAEYAARFPNEVRNLYLLGTPVFANEADARRRIHEMSPIAALFSLNRVLAREGCMFIDATRPLLKRGLPWVLRDLPPEVASDGVLHIWPSISGAIQILLTHPIAEPLSLIGRKVTFVHGAADTITRRADMRRLESSIGATVVDVSGDHHDYTTTGREALLRAMINDESPSAKASDSEQVELSE